MRRSFCRRLINSRSLTPAVSGCVLFGLALIVITNEEAKTSGASSNLLHVSDGMSDAQAEDSPRLIDVVNVYQNNCAVCHGPEGRGDGSAAYLLFPKPRDFTSGVFRFKSTPQGQPPTVDDVRRNIANGIARTAMPGFDNVLTTDEIDQLADYVLSLNEGATKNIEPTPIDVPAKPEFTLSLIADGARIYTTMRCGQCHGDTGLGDGPSSWDLVDAEGYPLPPADFTTGVFKAGDQSEDLYRTIMVGVPGTPMPSFQSALQAGIEVPNVDPDVDMVWAMVAYIESLEVERERSGIASGAVFRPDALRSASMIDNPFDRRWDAIDSTPIAIQPLWQRKWSTRAVELRIAADDQRIAFCLEWPDATVDSKEGLATATDAGALMFSLTDNVPFLSMGGQSASGEDMLVNLWQWKANRQIDADAKRRHDIPLGFAGDPVDLYMYKSGDPVQGDLNEHDRTFLPAWEVGNLNADPTMTSNPVFESNAAGFGTLTQQPADAQSVFGKGRWSNGKWRVVFVRDIAADGDGDVSFTSVRRVPFALAIWQGSALDRNGTKLVSGWHFLEFNR